MQDGSLTILDSGADGQPEDWAPHGEGTGITESLSVQVVSGPLPLHAPTVCFLQQVSWASNMATWSSQEDKDRGFQYFLRLSLKHS